MKVFARREPQTLSLIAPHPSAIHTDTVNSKPANRAEFSEARLRVIQLQPRWPRLSGAEIRRKLASVSQVEVMRVNWATIREGESHCIWPSYVIEKFATADVITEKSSPHYVLREANLTRVK